VILVFPILVTRKIYPNQLQNSVATTAIFAILL